MPDSIATAAWPAPAASASRVGSARGQSPIAYSSLAAVITLLGVFEQREEDLAVRVLAHSGGDLALELLDLGDQRPERRDHGEPELLLATG